MNKKGFSLIEMSIVLIIIGLLTSGIIGGTSLIESAKVRATINEINDLQMSFYTFLGIKNRLPGDIDDDGIIGACNGSKCSITKEPTTTKFGGEYYGKTVSHQVGPWVDLYLENLSVFKPNINGNLNIDSWKCDGVGSTRPYFKNISNSCIKGFRTFLGQTGKNDRYYLNIYSINTSSGLSNKMLKKLDEKVDDGISTTGDIQADCSSYDNKCLEIFYNFYDKL